MRRENRNPDNQTKGNSKTLYLVGSILALAIVAFIVTYAVYSNSSGGQNAKQYSNFDSGKIAELLPNTVENTMAEEASTQMGKSVEESKNEAKDNTSNTVNSNETKAPTTNASNTTNTEAKKEVTKKAENKEEKKEPDPTFVKPVEGECSKEYAKDNLVFSQTLNEWVTHQGIDIKSDKTTIVKAAAEGKVKAIKNDPRYGLTVVIEHTNGFCSVYANLLTSEFVVEGEQVKQGQTIGTVGNTAAFEIAEESHLHFEILKDNVAVDPNAYLK